MTSPPVSICTLSGITSFLLFLGLSTLILLLVAILLHIRTVIYVLRPRSYFVPHRPGPLKSTRRGCRGGRPQKGRGSSNCSQSAAQEKRGEQPGPPSQPPNAPRLLSLAIPHYREELKALNETLERVAVACETLGNHEHHPRGMACMQESHPRRKAGAEDEGWDNGRFDNRGMDTWGENHGSDWRLRNKGTWCDLDNNKDLPGNGNGAQKGEPDGSEARREEVM